MGKLNNKQKMIVLQLLILAAGVLVILYVKLNISQYMPPCSFKSLFGVICPTCGVTRCIANTLKLDIMTAITYHPTFFVLMIYLGILDIVYVINTLLGKKYFKNIYPTLPMICIYFTFFIIQYVYRVYMIVVNGEYQFL